MNIAHHLLRIAQFDPERPAIFRGEQLYLNYGQWLTRVQQLAHSLTHQLNLTAGDRVAILLHNQVEYLEILYAAWWAGLVVVPINAKLHPKEAEWIAEHAQCSAAFTTGDMQCEFSNIPHVVDVNRAQYKSLFTENTLPMVARELHDLAWLFYTSGTTGRPKGVMLTQQNLTMMGLSYFVDVDAISPNDANVYCAPMSHGAGMYAIPHVMAGARHVVPRSGGFEPKELFELSQHMSSLSMFAAPTMVKRLVDFAQANNTDVNDWADFKTIVYGGGPMYVADIVMAFDKLGDKFVQIYGQGECPMTITSMPRASLKHFIVNHEFDRLASVGMAQTPTQVRIINEHGDILPHNEVGEIQVRGALVMAGYWRNEAATQAAIKDGWLFTGDMGCLSADGLLTLKDRSKDVIISGGSNIYPREIEEVLLQSPNVHEVSVIGLPDAEWGEIVVAYVVLHAPQADVSEQLDTLCLDNIARFKRPKHYVFVDALPKNNYGKVLKTELRNLQLNPSH